MGWHSQDFLPISTPSKIEIKSLVIFRGSTIHLPIYIFLILPPMTGNFLLWPDYWENYYRKFITYNYHA
jgi:hypothetical protein